METIGGVAEYIAFRVLKELSPEVYLKRVLKATHKITSLNEKFLDTRQLAYDSGTLIYLVVDDLNLYYKEALSPNLDYVYDVIKTAFETERDQRNAEAIQLNPIQTRDVHEYFNDISTIDAVIESYEGNIKALVEKIIFDPKTEMITGEFTYCGYDPMNMKHYDKFVYHKHFLGVVQNGNADFLMGAYVTESEGDHFGHFIKYYKSVSE